MAGVQAAGVQGGQSFAVALADQVARTAPVGSRTEAQAPAPGSRLARPDRDGNLYAPPRLLPGRRDEGPNGSTQVASHGAADYSLGDLVDIINPLQQLPIVGTVYRALTGDTIKPEMRVAGGALYGGPIGLALAVADSAVEQVSGRDTGGNIVALFAPDRAPITRGSSSLFASKTPETEGVTVAEAGAPMAEAAAARQPATAGQAAAATPVLALANPGQIHSGQIHSGQIRPGALVAPGAPQPLMAAAAVPRAQSGFAAQGALGPPRPGAATPEMSSDGFNALMKSIGANSADAAGAAAASARLAKAEIAPAAQPMPIPVTGPAPQPAARVATAAGEPAPQGDGTTTINGAKFYPISRRSVPPPAPVPLSLPPRPGYNQAFVQMQQGLEKYQAMKAQTGATPADSNTTLSPAGAVLDSRF